MLGQSLDNKLESFLLDYKKRRNRQVYGYEVVSLSFTDLMNWSYDNITNVTNKSILVGNILVNQQAMNVVQKACKLVNSTWCPSAVVCGWHKAPNTNSIASLDDTYPIRHPFIHDDNNKANLEMFIISNVIWIGSDTTIAGNPAPMLYNMYSSTAQWKRIEQWYSLVSSDISAVGTFSRFYDLITFEGYLVNVNT